MPPLYSYMIHLRLPHSGVPTVLCPSHAHEAAPVMMMGYAIALCPSHAHEAAPVMPMRLPQS
jgi:hypothetical protein